MGIFDMFKTNKSTPEQRRIKNNTFIKNMGIACYENLPMIESSSEVVLKDLDTICKRAIACLLSTQVACDIQAKQNYEHSKEIFSKLLKEYGVEDYLLESEKKIFNNMYNEQDVINVMWTYECYWALIWALGLINDDEIKIPNDVCNCEKAVALVSSCKSFEEFKNKTKIRNIEEILDMLDLYYRYHWACVEKRINPNTNIGFLDSGVVLERRKGLEWLISNVYDWNSISLDT